jgi:hypothetical protein
MQSINLGIVFCAAIASQPSYGYFVSNDKGKSRDGLISIFKMSYDNASLFHCKMRSVGYSTPGQTISFPRKASSEGRTFVINFVDNLGKPGLCFA